MLTCPPPFGGGWRAQRAGRGNQKAMVNGGGNRLMFKGALPFIEAACGGPPSTTIVVPLPHRWGRQVLRRKAERHYIYLPPSFKAWVASIYYSLAPHRLRGGRGPRSGEGGICRWHTSAGSYIKWRPIFLRAPHSFTIYNSPLTIFKDPPLPQLHIGQSAHKTGY